MKWIEAAKEGQGYVLSAELKERRDTIEARAAEVLKKSGATPCTLYGIVDGSVIRSGMRFTARYFKHEGTTFSMELEHGTKATPDGFKLISANYYGKKGHERLRKDIDFLDEIAAAVEEGDMSQVHQLGGATGGKNWTTTSR